MERKNTIKCEVFHNKLFLCHLYATVRIGLIENLKNKSKNIGTTVVKLP